MTTMQQTKTPGSPRDIAGVPRAEPQTARPEVSAGALIDGQVRERAYQIYQERSRNGCQGDCVSDWLQAEREVNGSVHGGGPLLELKSHEPRERPLV